MTISAPTQIASFHSTGNTTTSGARTVTPGASVGNLVYVAVVAGGASITLGCSDSKGNTWTQLTPVSIASGSPMTVTFFYSVITSALVSATDTITVTRVTSGGLSMYANVVSGVDTSTPLDNSGTTGTGSSTTATTAIAAGTLSSVASGSLVVLAAGMGLSFNTFTAGSGFTVLQSGAGSGTGNPRALGTEYEITGSSGSVSPTATMGTGQAYAAMSVAFKAASAGTAASGTAALSLSGAGNTTSLGTASLTLSGSGTAVGRPGGTASLSLSGSGTGWGHPSVAIIGDSLTFRAEANDSTTSRESITRGRLQTAGYPADWIFWHGVGGKTLIHADSGGTTTMQDVAAAVTQLGPVIDAMVIGLGTNDVGSSDSTFTADLNTVLDSVASSGVTRLIWINLAFKSAVNTNALHFNPIIASTVGARGFAKYADWAGYVHNGRDESALWNTSDGTHMTSTGYALRDAYIIAQLGSGADGTGSITLTGSGASRAVGAGSGSITLSGSGAAKGRGVGDGSLTLTGSGAAKVRGTGTGALTLTGSGAAKATSAGTGALTLTASGVSTTAGTATGALTLTASGVAHDGSGTPQTIFTTETPLLTDLHDDVYSLGTAFTTDVDGQAVGARWYVPDTPPLTSPSLRLYTYDSDSAGTLLATKDMGTLSPGWNSVTFDTPVDLTATVLYKVAVGPVDAYVASSGMFTSSGITHGDLTAVQSGVGHLNGTFHVSNVAVYPDQEFGRTGYFVDVLFFAGAAPSALGQPEETDVAQPVGTKKLMPVEQVVETDTVTVVGRVERTTTGQPTESDTSTTVLRQHVRSTTETTELEAGTAVTRRKVKTLGQVVEIDAAASVSASGKVGQPAEIDQAQPVGRQKRRAAGQSTETDVAQAVGRRALTTLGQASELDEARRISTSSGVAELGQVVEVDLAQPVGRRQLRSVGQVTEVDLSARVYLLGAPVPFVIAVHGRRPRDGGSGREGVTDASDREA